MRVAFVDLKKQYETIKNEINNAIQNVLESAAFIKGKFVEEFESNFAKKLGVKYCIGVGNGTDALIISLKTLGIGAGDEVIVPANSFIATSEAVTAVGAKVVFVDIDSHTYNIDVHKVEEKISSKTKAIIPVHLYGQPADMNGIVKLARKYNLKIIEDTAQAHFAEYFFKNKWKYTGTIGDIGTFSFYPGKNLGAYGDGGAIVTDNPEFARIARMLANHGRIAKYNHEIEGYNSRLDGIQAAILNVKLRYIDRWNKNRRKIASEYAKLLKNETNIILPTISKNTIPVWHLFVIRTHQRNELKKHLENKGISTGIHYPIALPNLEAYKYLNYKMEDFPVASLFQNEILSLPMFPELAEYEVLYVANEIMNFFRETE